MPLKVAHLSSAHHYFDTRLLHRECKSLRDAGFEVHLIAQHTKDETVDGIHLHGVPKPSGKLSRMLTTPWQVYRRARAVDPAIYHLHDPELLPVGRLLAAQGKRVIFDAHENVPAQLLTKEYLRFHRLVSSSYAALEAWILSKNIRIIMAETSYTERYSRFDAGAVTVLNYPVVGAAVPEDAARDGLVYVGGVTRDRGIRETVAALGILKKRGVTPQFHCIGAFSDEELEKEIRAQVRASGLEEQITFYGKLDSPQAFKIASACELGLSLLHVVPNHVGSYPTKMFEYMMLSLPFVVSDIPLYTRAMRKSGDAGVSVDPLDTAAVADKIAYLLDNPQEARAMGQRGRRAVEEYFNWATEAEKLVGLYREMLGDLVTESP